MPYNNEPSDLIEFLGFAPDADPNLPGTWSDCTLVIPNHRGFQTPPVPGATAGMGTVGSLSGYTPLHSYYGFLGSVEVTIMVATSATAGEQRVFQFAEPNVYDITPDATSWTASPFAVSGVQFGDYYLISGAQDMTLAAATGLNIDLAKITNGPRAVTLLVAERFVVALGTNYLDATAGWQGDRWWCSARDDHTSWTAAPATQAATGRLPDQYGYFTGGIVLQNLIYAFKERTCYVGRYTGPPEIWSWKEWPFRVGAVCEPAHYKKTFLFLATDDLYQFDGANLRSLMSGSILRWFATKLPATYGARLVVDEARDLVYLGIASGGTDSEATGTTNSYTWLVCHIPSGRWGKANLPGISFYFSAPGSFWTGRGPGDNETQSLWAVDSAGTIRFMDGVFSTSDATAQPSITLNDFGDAFADSEVSGARIKFLAGPEASTLIPMHRNTLDATLATLTAVARNDDGDYNYRHNARWHRLKFLFTTGTDRLLEMTGIRINSEPRGRR